MATYLVKKVWSYSANCQLYAQMEPGPDSYDAWLAVDGVTTQRVKVIFGRPLWDDGQQAYSNHVILTIETPPFPVEELIGKRLT